MKAPAGCLPTPLFLFESKVFLIDVDLQHMLFSSDSPSDIQINLKHMKLCIAKDKFD